ncbi:MAG: nucleotidyltransferase domain-containing protein [Deltaproteobacteria bacterium]|nr:nucleotidyltransferase domain-containing protein [Deltaproteobacteria bacterium]
MNVRLPGSHHDALEGYAARLRRRFAERLRFVRLFGSWARGTAGPDSDIDVAVVIEGLTPAEWAEAVDLAAESEIGGGEALSPFVVSGARFDGLLRRERRLASDVLAEGVEL